MYTAKAFLSRVLVISLGLMALFVGVNYQLDIYGLFDNNTDAQLRVYTNEHTSKYLLSHRYIPKNYEGFILGPSLSANLNPDAIQSYNTYNASIMGANISELKPLAIKIAEEGNMKFAVLCLSPYITKDYGKKSARIDPKEYYGALGSTNLLKTYAIKTLSQKELLPQLFPKSLIEANGCNNFNLAMDTTLSEEIITHKVANGEKEATYIDPRAYEDLAETIAHLRKNGIQIFGYYPPVPKKILDLDPQSYRDFQAKIGELFTSKDVLIDFNTPEHQNITTDFSCYIDHGHLNHKGQQLVAKEINKCIQEHLPPNEQFVDTEK